MRRPLERWVPYPVVEGEARGIPSPNVPDEVVALVTKPDGGVDATMAIALQTTLSYEDLVDLLEIDDVGRSWRAAVARNMDASRGGNHG